MIENTTSQGDWPNAPHQVRKRRNSRVVYHHSPKYFHRNVSIPSASISPPRVSASRPSVQIHQQSLPGQTNDFNDPNFWKLQSAPAETQHSFGQIPHQDGQTDVSWHPSMISYNYPSIPPKSPLSPHDDTPSPQAGPAQTFSRHEVALSWEAPNPAGDNFNSEVDVGSFSSSDFGRFGSFDSMDVSNTSTMASSISESYVMPGANNGVELPGDKIQQLQDLSLDEYFQTMQAYDPSSSNAGKPISPTSPSIQEPFPIDNDFSGMQDWTDVSNVQMYNNEMVQWPTAAALQTSQMQSFQFGHSSTSTQIPWNHQTPSFNGNANAGNVAFEPPQGPGFGAYLVGQDFLDNCQRDLTPQASVSPTGDDSENDGWQTVTFPSYANSSVPSHDSPQSAMSPFEMIDTPHQTPSPRPHHNDHQHVFTFYPGITKPTPKLPRGRQRRLTTKEKKEAREVREAKACWACHLSKIKCSPCSPGSPCKKCAELIGKRRFCHLPCFNDPLESLYTFMVPDYLMGHFTRANVEEFVRNNATAWGTQEIVIRMTWGYWEPLVATVVPLEIHGNSQIGVHHQASVDGTNRPTLVRKSSPPLGIPLAAMDDMQADYHFLLQGIVRDNLSKYVSIAYDDQDSDLPERLLTSIGTFFRESKDAGDEIELLRQVLEIHVVCTILERSLILDDESIYKVENCLDTKFPPRSAARCVQRQVKLAFFEVQRKRIVKVLEAWGSMMWSSNKSTTSDKKWAISFSVFLGLILAIDKTLGQGYFFCETRIAYHDAEERSERRQFQELVRLTQTELFERCKEIFHSSFKTRKNGKEACNPIRDGMGAFKNQSVSRPIERLVDDLRMIAREFGREIRSHRSAMPDPSEEDEPYLDAGRLACIFLDDFVDR